MIIVVGGQKGGGGKTTMATNLATMFVLDKHDVLLYDTDPQRTATLWASRRDENSKEYNLARVNSTQKVLDKRVINIGVVIRNEILALKQKYEDIIIDAGGADNEALRAALSIANLAIFPIIPSEFDMWTFDTLSNLVATDAEMSGKLKAKILFNKVNTNHITAKKEIDEGYDFLSDFNNLSSFKNYISERIIVRRASGKGMATVEYKPVDTKATDEINAIYKEVKHAK